MVPRGGIEPPTRGFSVRCSIVISIGYIYLSNFVSNSHWFHHLRYFIFPMGLQGNLPRLLKDTWIWLIILLTHWYYWNIIVIFILPKLFLPFHQFCESYRYIYLCRLRQKWIEYIEYSKGIEAKMNQWISQVSSGLYPYPFFSQSTYPVFTTHQSSNEKFVKTSVTQTEMLLEIKE